MKKAFTLAETLITLVIVGIIAVMVYSNLMRVKPDENATLYKKAFYSVQEAVRALANDDSLYPDAELMFKYEPAKADADDYNLAFCKNMANALNTIGEIKCSSNKITSGASTGQGDFTNGKYDFKLTNGMVFSGFNQEFTDEDSNSLTSDTITVCVDVNGIGKGVDKGCKASESTEKNRDRFRMRIHYDGKVSTDKNWTGENAILENPGISTK